MTNNCVFVASANDQVEQDILRHCGFLKARYPAVPIFIYGEWVVLLDMILYNSLFQINPSTMWNPHLYPMEKASEKPDKQ